MGNNDFLVPRHPISVVSERTGLSLDVLRVWERRYGVVEPARAPGGQRLYSDQDVTRLRLLHAATGGGRSIGQVAHLDTRELAALVAEDDDERIQTRRESPQTSLADDYVEQALARTLALDGGVLDMILRRAMTSLGLWVFAEGVVVPLLRRIGDGWHAREISPAQEHLASAAIRRVLLSATDLLPRAANGGNIVVVTPANDRHEMGALLTAAGATVEGWQVTYLGSDLPAEEIAMVAIETEARVVALSVTYITNRDQLLEELRTVRARVPADVAVLVGGIGAVTLKSDLAGTGIRVLEDLTELRAFLLSSLPGL